MSRRSAKLSAFTLIEMTVALVLVSAITLSLYSSLRIGFRAERSARAAMGPTLAAGAAMAVIQRDLEAVLSPTGLLAGEFVSGDAAGGTTIDGAVLSFHTCSGNSDIEYPGYELEDDLTLSSFGNTRPPRVSSDFQRVDLLLLRDEENADYNLVRSVTRNLLAPTTPAPMDQVICRNVISFEILYLDGSEWIDSWDSTQQEDALPAAVEISLEVRCVEPTGTWSDDLSQSQSVQPLSLGSEISRRTVHVIALPTSVPSTEEGDQYIR